MRKDSVTVGSERWKLTRLKVGEYYITTATQAAVNSAISGMDENGNYRVSTALVILSKPQRTLKAIHVERVQ